MDKTDTTNNIKSGVIICGGRYFNDYDTLETSMNKVMSELSLTFEDIEIISGHCSGADQLGEQYAKKHNINCKIFPAEWKKYGKSAGPIRNSKMIRYAAGTELPVVVAFVSPQCKGTMDTLNKAKSKGFNVFVVEYEIVGSSVNVIDG